MTGVVFLLVTLGTFCFWCCSLGWGRGNLLLGKGVVLSGERESVCAEAGWVVLMAVCCECVGGVRRIVEFEGCEGDLECPARGTAGRVAGSSRVRRRVLSASKKAFRVSLALRRKKEWSTLVFLESLIVVRVT